MTTGAGRGGREVVAQIVVDEVVVIIVHSVVVVVFIVAEHEGVRRGKSRLVKEIRFLVWFT